MRAGKLAQTLAACGLATILVAGCSSSESTFTKDQERNFRQGMTPEMAKKVGPAPTPPAGPLEGYKGGSAADKAQGR